MNLQNYFVKNKESAVEMYESWLRNNVPECPDSLQIFQKRVRYYSGWVYEKSQCLSRWLFSYHLLHHLPEGALRLVGLRGVHLAEVEGDAEHDIATHHVAVYIFHVVGGDAPLQGFLLV